MKFPRQHQAFCKRGDVAWLILLAAPNRREARQALRQLAAIVIFLCFLPVVAAGRREDGIQAGSGILAPDDAEEPAADNSDVVTYDGNVISSAIESGDPSRVWNPSGVSYGDWSKTGSSFVESTFTTKVETVDPLERYTTRSEIKTCDNEFVFAPRGKCPDACKYFAESATEFCQFACVDEAHCGRKGLVADAVIADKKRGECRRCEVEGCKTCTASQAGDRTETCEQCMFGYFASSNKERCIGIHEWVFLVIMGIGALICLAALIWYIDLCIRPRINEAEVEKAVEWRSRAKTRNMMVRKGPLFDEDTNLLTENVAGAGCMVLFRFQAAILIWAMFALLLFSMLAITVKHGGADILAIGIRVADTPQQMCDVVQWGRKRQIELIWTKVTWLSIFYIFSFCGATWYCFSSEAVLKSVDVSTQSMKDYVAKVTGIPKVKGDSQVENDVRVALEEALGDLVVGVSIGWDIHDTETHAKVQNCCMHELAELSREFDSMELEVKKLHTQDVEIKPSASMKKKDTECPRIEYKPREGPWGKLMDFTTNILYKAWKINLDEKPPITQQETIEFLESLQTTDVGWVVFSYEVDKNDAIKRSREMDGIDCNGFKLHLHEEEHEPEAIHWGHVGISDAVITKKFVFACLWMLLAVVLWVLVMYLPYEHWLCSFTYVNGDEPKQWAELLMVCLVFGSQMGLFVLAHFLAHHIGFMYEDSIQWCHMVLYFWSLIINLVMDMLLQAVLGYEHMVGRGVHTADGRLLKDLDSVSTIFESYPMQKSIGNQLFRYAWPATFLLPYAAEVPFLYWLPYHVGRLLIRADPRLKGWNAELCMRMQLMEQGRFADLAFNAILACGAPFLAPAWTMKLFLTLLISHLFLFGFDHFRTLRYVERFHFSSNLANRFGQKLFSIPCAMLAMGIVFKVNQMNGNKEVAGSGPLKGAALWAVMLIVFAVHMALHMGMLFGIPYLADRLTFPSPENKAYQDCSKMLPGTWFSTNPVHCLRSKAVYDHSPPQTYFVVGKEHLAQVNSTIGAYYGTTDENTSAEDNSQDPMSLFVLIQEHHKEVKDVNRDENIVPGNVDKRASSVPNKFPQSKMSAMQGWPPSPPSEPQNSPRTLGPRGSTDDRRPSFSAPLGQSRFYKSRASRA